MGVANAPVYNMNMPTSSWACYPAIRPGRAPREGSRRLGAALAYVQLDPSPPPELLDRTQEKSIV